MQSYEQRFLFNILYTLFVCLHTYNSFNLHLPPKFLAFATFTEVFYFQFSVCTVMSCSMFAQSCHLNLSKLHTKELIVFFANMCQLSYVLVQAQVIPKLKFLSAMCHTINTLSQWECLVESYICKVHI